MFYFVLLSLNFPLIPIMSLFLDFDTWHDLGRPFPSFLYSCNMCHMSNCYIRLLSHQISFYGTRYSVPRKICKFQLSRKSTKFDVLARFHETIQTVKSVSSSEIYKNFGFLPKLQFCPFLENWNFFGSYILPSLKRISSRNSTHIRIQPRAYVTLPNSKTVSGMTTRLRSQLLTTRWLSTHTCQE